jgi:hypothetical protein
VLAQRNFLNYLEINAKQEFRELSARLLLPQWRQGARFGAQGESDKHASHAAQTIRALSRATRYCERDQYCCFLDFLVQSLGWLVRRLHKSHASLHQIRNLGATQIRRQKDHRLRQSTLLLSPSVSVALSRIPSNSWNGRALVSVRNSVFAKQVELNRMVKHLLR